MVQYSNENKGPFPRTVYMMGTVPHLTGYNQPGTSGLTDPFSQTTVIETINNVPAGLLPAAAN